MSFLSDIFGKGKKKQKLDVPITKLPSSSAAEDSTEVRPPSAQQALPEIKDTKPFEAKKIPVWKPGDVILDHYEIEDVITSGGMGLVYIANHQNWKVKIAIKSPTEEMLQDKDFFARVQKEAEAWTELGLHPNIAYCYFVRNIEDVPHIFVEYVDGGNLRQWIQDGRCADLRIGLDLAIQFCHGMAYAHSKGMIHRDIKPANILMTKDGTLKITDFGIAKWLRVDETGKLHEGSGVDLGGKTPPYASPEQFIDEYNVGFETDVFSFGLCLWEMLCGIKPYTIAVEKVEIPNPRKLRPDLPEKLHILLEQLVAFEKEERQKLGGFEALRERFKSIYQELFNELSPHSELEQIDLEADGLNNQGISFAELGKWQEAEVCFRGALEKEPLNPQALYNRSLLEWRSGRIADDEVVRRLETCMDASWLDIELISTLLAKVHAERFQPRLAKETLQAYPGAFEKVFEQRSLPEILLPVEIRISVKNNRALRFTHDSRTIITLGRFEKETVCFYEADTADLISCIGVQGAEMEELALNIEGSRLLVGGGRHLALCSTEKRGIFSIIEIPEGKIQRLAILVDGNSAVVQSDKVNLGFWNLKTAQGTRIPLKVKAFLGSILEFSPKGVQALYTQPDNHSILLLNTETGEKEATLEGHTDRINWISFDRNGVNAVTASDDRSLRLWDLTSASCRAVLQGHVDDVCSVSMDAQAKLAISTGIDRTVRIWDLETCRCVTSIQSPLYRSVLMSPDGSKAITGDSEKKRYYSWDLSALQDKGRYVAEWAFALPRNYGLIGEETAGIQKSVRQVDQLIDKGHKGEAFLNLSGLWKSIGYRSAPEITKRYYSLDSRGRRQGLITVYPNLRMHLNTQAVDSACFLPNGQMALTASRKCSLNLWDLKSGIKKATLEGHIMPIDVIRCNRKGTLALTGGSDMHIRLWDIKGKNCVGLLKGHTDPIKEIQFSQDECLAFSAASPGSYPAFEFAVWDLNSQKLIQSSKGKRDSYSSVAICPRRTIAACGTWNGIVRLWDFKDQKAIASMEGHTGPVVSIAFSPDGRCLLTGGDDKTIRLWDLETLNCKAVMNGHEGYIKTLDFSPDGTKAVCGCSYNKIYLWDLTTRTLMIKLKRHAGIVNKVVFSPDGHCFISTSSDGSIILWSLIWNIDFPESTDWDEVARPYLHNLLSKTSGHWNDNDLKELLEELACKRGLGWIRPEGIRRQIVRIAEEWSPEKPWIANTVPKDTAMPKETLAPLTDQERKDAFDEIIKNTKPIALIDGIDFTDDLLDPTADLDMNLIWAGVPNLSPPESDLKLKDASITEATGNNSSNTKEAKGKDKMDE